MNRKTQPFVGTDIYGTDLWYSKVKLKLVELELIHEWKSRAEESSIYMYPIGDFELGANLLNYLASLLHIVKDMTPG